MAPTTSEKIRAASHDRTPSPEAMKVAVTRRLMLLLKANKIKLVNPPLGKSGAFMPRCELYEDPSSNLVIATFELPGVNKQEIDLHLRDGYLVIEGERRRRPDDEDVGLLSQRRRLQKEHARSSSQGCSLDIVTPVESVPRYQTTIASGDSHPDEKLQFRVQELRFGKFERRIQVPPETRDADITAQVAEGMLTVTWPRQPASRSRVNLRPLLRGDSTHK